MKRKHTITVVLETLCLEHLLLLCGGSWCCCRLAVVVVLDAVGGSDGQQCHMTTHD